MTNINDQKIMELKKQIEEKKKKVGKSQRFTPTTNCLIDFENTKLNIQVLTREQIISIIIKLNSFANSAKELDLLADFNISGYNVMNWIEDLKSKLDFLSRKEEERKLKAMEAKLDLLLSNDKKVELEIDEIENMLKD